MRAGLPIVLSIAMAMSGVPALALEEVNAGNDDEDIAAVAEVVDDETLDEQEPLDELDAIAEDIEAAAGAEESKDAAPIEDAEAVETDEEKSSLAVQSDDEAPSSQSELSGTIGTCAWNIDSNGCLTIKPTNGSVGELPDQAPEEYNTWPWTQGHLEPVIDGKYDTCGKVQSVRIQGCVICGSNASSLFAGMVNARTMNLEGLDTSRVTKMNGMFYDSRSLKELDLTGFDTSKVKDMGWMFFRSGIEVLDISAFDMTNVTNAEAMYYWCGVIRSIKVGTGYRFDVMDANILGSFPFEIYNKDGSITYERKWWSYAAQKWFTPSEMRSARTGIADTYTSTPVYDLSKATVTVAKGFSYIYNGTARTPEPTVTFGSTTLQAGTHYTVSYKNNVNAGTATVTVTGKGDYEGSKSATFKIVPADIDRAKVTSIKNQAYTGKALKPSPKITFGGKTLKKGTDYTLSYAKNKKVGKATVTIKGKGNFSGTKKVTFKIVPKETKVKRLKAGAKAFTVKWAKQAKQTTGYQIQYSRSATFAKGNKTVTVKKTTITSRKVKGLLAKKKYYVRVRTYRKVGGVTYYSVWSAKKAVTTK